MFESMKRAFGKGKQTDREKALAETMARHKEDLPGLIATSATTHPFAVPKPAGLGPGIPPNRKLFYNWAERRAHRWAQAVVGDMDKWSREQGYKPGEEADAKYNYEGKVWGLTDEYYADYKAQAEERGIQDVIYVPHDDELGRTIRDKALQRVMDELAQEGYKTNVEAWTEELDDIIEERWVRYFLEDYYLEGYAKKQEANRNRTQG